MVRLNIWSLELALVASQESPPMAELEHLTATVPADHWPGRVALAQAAVRAGAPDKALSWLVSEADSAHPWIHKARAEALAAISNWSGALAEWEKAKDVKALQRAGDEAFAASREEEGRGARWAWFRLDPIGGALPLAAAVWRVDRDAAQATELLEKTLTEHPDAPVPDRVNWLYALSTYSRKAKVWDRAEAANRRMEELVPGDFRSYLGRGWVTYQRDGDVEGALALFRQAQERASDRGEPWAEGGALLLREKRYPEAERWYAEAIARNPQNRWWHLARANAVRNTGDLERAVNHYRETTELFPTFLQGYYELAWAYSLQEKHAEAIAAIGQAIELPQGENPNILTRAGLIYERAGRPETALRYFGQVLSLFPNHVVACEALARLQPALK